MTVFFALCCCAVSAQMRYEVNLQGSGGISTLMYKVADNENSVVGTGGSAGVGYTHFFTKNIGIATGVAVAFHNATAKFDGMNATLFDLYDVGGNRYNLITTIRTYTERQDALLLNIPLMLGYQSAGNGGQFYAQAGVKAGIPLRVSYRSSDASLTNECDYGLRIPEEPPVLTNVGNFSGRNYHGNTQLKTALLLAVEVGVKWQFSETYSLYSGVYMDYGLNDLRNNQGESFVNSAAATTENFTTNSSLIALQTNGERMAGKVLPVAAGIMLRLSFGQTLPIRNYFSKLPSAVVLRDESDFEQWRQNDLAQKQQYAKQQQDTLVKLQWLIAQEQQQGAAYRNDMDSIELPLTGYHRDDTRLSRQQKRELDKKIALLKKHSELTVVCMGHTCDTGTDTANYLIGRNRAEVVGNYLITHGIQSSRIAVLSKGSTQPLCPNINEENRKRNRRVEIVILISH